MEIVWWFLNFLYWDVLFVLNFVVDVFFNCVLVLVGRVLYKVVLIYGFVFDERGYKMSKFIGNVVDFWSVIEGGKN